MHDSLACVLSVRGVRNAQVSSLKYSVHDQDGLFLGVIPRSVLSYARKRGFVITPVSSDTGVNETIRQSVLLEPKEAPQHLQKIHPVCLGKALKSTDG